ncbi:MAG TPA: serine/threonine-protein kinase, partial [Polyangiaceae bacterium]|nr:serine/threonine-protein kinase [Polyangiaceae bacterium]
VLEWVDGLDLLEYMRSFHQGGVHVPWQAAAAIALQALRGLVGAHERVDSDGMRRPVIHRDLSPSNILIGTDGVVKIADFGLARAMDRMTMTLPNVIKGKLAYTAPEVATGKKATERSDLFSLGITLWECLGARRIFPGETNIDVFRAIQAWDFPPLHELRPDIPADLILAIGRAMERDPNRRFSTAREMAAVFAGVMRDARPHVGSTALGASVSAAKQRLVALDQDIPITLAEVPSAVSELSIDVPVDFSSSPSVARVGSRRSLAVQSIDDDDDFTPTERRLPEPLIAEQLARERAKGPPRR